MIDTPATAFLDECAALDDFVSQFGGHEFAAVTDFYGWSVRDEVMHLLFLDALTLDAVERETFFLEELARIRAFQAAGGELSQYMRERYADIENTKLLAAWRTGYRRLGDSFARRDPKTRMKWFGPNMSLRSAISARQMEVWAHGQDIYDLFGIRREPHDRIKNICELGVRTYRWSFLNRQIPPPGPAPRLVLDAPSGDQWVWNETAKDSGIEGGAEDFALVVTQRRHFKDTGLVIWGAAAIDWMVIAQCFAGAPADGPAPGVRGIRPSKG